MRGMQAPLRLMAMLRLVPCLAFLAAAGAFADALADARIDQARHEGEVVWYTAMNVPDTDALRKPFVERYPFLKLTVLRATGEKVRTRILTEARARRFSWDIVSFNLLDMDALAAEGLLAAYQSPEAATGYAPGAVDPQGRWAAIYVRQYVIGYNTRQVKPDEAPRSWSDLLAPRWAGKIALDESDVEWYAAMLDYWGRDKAVGYMRALSRQKPQQRRGHSLLTRLLVAGDFPLALVHAAEIEKEKQEGAPVEWVRTLDPVVTSPSQVAISARAPHPSAARLFVDFLLSSEGQALIKSRGRVPARRGIDSDAETLKAHYVDPRLAAQFNRYEKEFREIFGRVP